MMKNKSHMILLDVGGTFIKSSLGIASQGAVEGTFDSTPIESGGTAEQIEAIHNTCRILFQSDLNYITGCDKAESELPQSAERDYLIKFVRDSKRGVIKQYMSRR